ncbi:lipase family protein [Helicobacter typhlonius]|uniref:lipase family protein n=1 Tax=Helicobacter typhlonius TaxID=76936 RepID=UPI002FE0A1DF
MKNKELINKLKNNAELAWAAYGYYDLLANNYGDSIIKLEDSIASQINLADILDNTHKGYEVFVRDRWDKEISIGKLDGDMTKNQAIKFFERYNLLDFYPKLDNTTNKQQKGFHACLFQNKKSKEYTLAIRGSSDSKDYIEADFQNLLVKSSISKNYFEKMLNFYESCAKKYPAITQPKSLNVAGHSLGGALAQLFALSFSTDKDSSIINEVYTFNSPGAKDLKPPYEAIIYIPSITDNAMGKFLLHSLTETLKQEALALHLVIQENDFKQKVKEILNNTSNADTYLGINFYYNNNEQRTLNFNYEKVDKYFLSSYQTLIHNYNNRNKKNYRLSISESVYHIETDSDNNPNNSENNLIQNLGEDIEGKHYYINIGIDIEGLERHSIKSSALLLSFYDYLLDLEANRELLVKHMQELETNKQSPVYQNYIGHKASKNKGKYQVITALLNDFIQWTYNSLQEVKKVVLKEEKEKYKQQKKSNKNSQKPPEKIFPLAYLLSEISYIARIKNNKAIQEFDLYKMIDIITQLQETKIYTRILDKDFFDNLKNKKCSVAEIRSLLKCQPFIVVDENNEEILNEDNMTKLFFYKEFTTLASQILNTYGGKAV